MFPSISAMQKVVLSEIDVAFCQKIFSALLDIIRFIFFLVDSYNTE